LTLFGFRGCYALSNPLPTGVQAPSGSSLGPLTFLGRGPSFSNPDVIVPNVHQFSVGIQRELPARISLDVAYAGSRSDDFEGNFGGYNEPSAAFQAQCDVTFGGSRSLCDQLITNPYCQVAGFEGTTRFTNATCFFWQTTTISATTTTHASATPRRQRWLSRFVHRELEEGCRRHAHVSPRPGGTPPEGTSGRTRGARSLGRGLQG
jgi:hypothetical protein